MQIRRYRDPALFLDRAGPFLSRAEGENNLFLGMGGRPGSTPPVLGEECYLATIERAEEVVACALRTPPYGVVIARADLSALELLINDLTSKYETLPSVLGPEPAVSVFAQHWSQRAGTRTRPLMRMRLFEARHVRSPERHIPGVLRIAEERDLTMVTAWAV